MGTGKANKYILHSPYHPIHPGTGTFSERDFVFIFRKNPESYKFIMKKCRPYIHDKKKQKKITFQKRLQQCCANHSSLSHNMCKDSNISSTY